jgi:RHS repeat-associated protein
MVTADGDLYGYHFDAIGNTIAMTDDSEQVVNAYAYTPFGIITSKQETIPQPFTFVGQHGVMTEPNGMYYMRARYYDPQTGRFISQDPLGFDGGDVNLYIYAKNNPIVYMDPSGEINIWGGVVGGIVGGAGGVLGAMSSGDFSASNLLKGFAGGAAGGFLGGMFDVSVGVGAGVGAAIAAGTAAAMGENLGGIIGAGVGGGIGGALAVYTGGASGVALGTWVGASRSIAFGMLGSNLQKQLIKEPVQNNTVNIKP